MMDGSQMLPPVLNLSRREGLLAAGGLLLSFGLVPRAARAQPVPHATAQGHKVQAFLRIAPDGTIHLLSPFIEGGQGIFTGMAMLVAEDMDADLKNFVVTAAPPAGPEFATVNGRRLTGGSFSTRTSYTTMRTVGATARAMLMQAAADKWGVDPTSLLTETGIVAHPPTGRRLTYGELADAAAALTPPTGLVLKDASRFRVIGTRAKRLDTPAKSTGQARYAIDTKVPDMLQAALVHAPRGGMQPASVTNEAAVRAMRGVHSVHPVPGAFAVVADTFWRARQGAEALRATWTEATAGRHVPADFSSAGHLARLKEAARRPGNPAENEGDVEAALAGAARRLSADYDAPFLAHAQMEPMSTTARFNPDGTLDLWVPNQAPEAFQALAARAAGLQPAQVRIHSPLLGGFFGRHFTYGPGNAFPQAIALAKVTGRPVKLTWTREEEFNRDAYRPLAHAAFEAGLDASGKLVALRARAAGEGPVGMHFGTARMGNPPVDSSVVEGIAGKPYRIANKRIDYVPVASPVTIGFWRAVGHSMNDYFFESFLDECAEAGGQDKLAMRRDLLAHSPRHLALLDAVVDLSGGWKPTAFVAADGSRRARGIALASPFGSETATIAEVSVRRGEVVVHDLWIAIDPGRIVNPALVEAQVRSAATIGLSSALLEEVVFENGAPIQRNFDTYPILARDRMPNVHARIVESGAPIGGVGEPGTPGVPPAVANAVATLTGQRLRSLPLSKARLGAA